MIKPARIRFDDFIWKSKDPKMKGKEVQKAFKNVNWCVNTGVQLTPAILCQDIEQFPEGISLLREMIEEGVVYPDLHGWTHGPYAPMSQSEVEEHLDKAITWFKENLGVLPIRWSTPHGADSPSMRSAASKYDLVLETTEYPVVDEKILDTQLRQTRNLDLLDGIVIMNHYWNRGLRLYRISRIIEYQSIDEAIESTCAELSERDFNICWNGWINE
jgi:hypothetical protein